MVSKEKEELENRLNGTAPNGYETPLQVERPVYQIEDLNRDTLYEKPHSSLKTKCKNVRRNWSCTSYLLQTIPILKWLPEYSWKSNIMGDIISGITVAIMHIPQGMAYGMLGGVPPIIGIYMAFFPVLVYVIFGTSRHVSMGTFAIVCLMTGKVVNSYSTVEVMQNGTLHALPMADGRISEHEYTNIAVASTVTFTVAMIQIPLYFLRLGILSTLLSDTLVDGFTCAAAFHVASSQLKDLMGLPIGKRRGNFSFILTVRDAILAIPHANRYACAVSLIACIVIIINNELIKQWLAKKTRFPFPIELMAVVLGTVASYFLHFEEGYDITVVGRIPTGFPTPTLPLFELIPQIFVDSFVIMVVSYTVTMSMAYTFSRKLMYEVDSNQELLALGLSNTIGSFFSCLPITASLSRSMIQQSVGGVTQLASVVSCFLLMFVLLWIGPFFELLPKCVLTSIIIVSLKGILFKVTAIKKYWKLSKWDAFIWIVTFSTTIIFQISVGLAAGVIASLLSIFVQGYKPYNCLLGVIPNTDLYLDLKRHKGAQELDKIKIFHFSGSLNFATRTCFKDLMNKRVGFDAQEVLRWRAKKNYIANDSEEDFLLTKYVILDFTSVSYVDPSGVDLLRQIKADYAKLDIVMYLAGCSAPVYEIILKCDRMEKKDSNFVIFPTVHDAVLYAQTNMTNEKIL